MIGRACDGGDFRFRLGASNAVWSTQTRREQQRRKRKLAPARRVTLETPDNSFGSGVAKQNTDGALSPDVASFRVLRIV